MRVLFTAIAVTSLLGLGNGTLTAGELYVAFWNVENLFDTDDDPNLEGDEEFTPDGPKKWTPGRFGLKTKKLARVIKDMNDGRGPDVLGMCEIENRGVIESLSARLEPLGRDYKIVHKDSPSDRGIDCALIYDAGRLELKGSDFIFVDADNTRDIVEARFQAGGGQLYVFVNHWPSRSTNPEPARITAAKALRARVDELLETDEDAEIVIVGDLNDYPPNVSVTDHLRARKDPDSLAPGDLFNSMWPVHDDPGAGTYVYKNKWDVLDHVILSPGLLDDAGLHWKEGSTKVVLRDYQIYTPSNPEWIPRPSRTYSYN